VSSVHTTLETYVEQAICDQQFRDLHPGIVIQLLTGALNASMDLDAWQPIDDLDQRAGDYFSVFFFGLALPKTTQ
jgi:hypothetical protein